MAIPFLADTLAQIITDRTEIRIRRLRASLVAESGDSLIVQGEGLQRTRRNVYWIGGVVLLLLLARPEDGKAEISLFASLTLPIYPLLIGLLLYLALSLFQFRQELWRETLRHNMVSSGSNRIGELERVTGEVIETIKRVERSTKSWGASIVYGQRAGWVPSADRTIATLKTQITNLQQAQTAFSGMPAEPPIGAAYIACNDATDALQNFVEEFGDADVDQRNAKLDEATFHAARLMTELEEMRQAIKVETDSFFTLSSDLKFRERLVFMLVDSLLPTLFAIGAIFAGINYLLVAIMAQPLHVFEEPWCPVCPVSEIASAG